MIQRAAYFLREAFNGLSLRPGTNAASVLSIGLVLAVFAAVVGVSHSARHLVAVVSSQAQLAVFLGDGASREEFAAVISALRTLPNVSSVKFVSEQEALREMAGIVGKGGRDILAAFEGYNPFAPYIEVTVPPHSAAEVAAAAARIPGVEYVRDNEDVISSLIRVEKVTGRLGLAMGAAVAVTSSLVVSHIVLLGIHARREEIEVMRLLGASELFIAFPFLLEGILLGTLGSLVACAIQVGIWGKVYNWVSSATPFIPLADKTGLLLYLFKLVAVFGIGSAAVGSLVALGTLRTLANSRK